MTPGEEALREVAAKATPPGARVLEIPDAGALPRLSEGADVVVAPWPTRFAPLIPFLGSVAQALPPEGRLIVLDLVWNTAPSAELMRAFAPAAGREKVRPIEGFEMQTEHAGFDVAERVVVDRARWVHALPTDARAAVEADTRGAARLVVWVLKPHR